MGTLTSSVALIVRRGALRRFHKLTRRAADLPVKIWWDRRQSDRRAHSMEVCGERRRGDRRKNPPFTWQAGDFVVVPTEETTTTRTRD